jgi:cyclopropane fatty-acyl-phospholipid synthase-like methyltransferase
MSDPRSLAELDALLADTESQRWDGFYADRAKPCPFFGTAPDESLVEWVTEGQIAPGKAIDMGCGNARNAICLASQGFSVEGVDYSPNAVAWAAERIREAGETVSLQQASVFDLSLAPASYDLVYDSGCFHHMPPHRRPGYVDLVVNALKPGGFFGLTCFKPEGGSGYTDEEVYERRSTGGGFGYTEERLREIWGAGALEVLVLRQMQELPFGSPTFGKSFLWAMLARKR